MSQPDTKKGLLEVYLQGNLLIKILIGLILGAIAGLVFQDAIGIISFLKPFGDIFVRLLKMIIVPVVMASLIIGCSSIAPSELGKVGFKIIGFYLGTSLLAIVIGLFVGTLMQPGFGLDMMGVSSDLAKTAESPTVSEILVNLVPTNPIGAMASGNILQIITFSLFFGIALAFIKDSKDEKIKQAGELIYSFFEGINQILYKIIGWIMQYAPIGVFALIFVVFSTQGGAAFGSLFSVTISVYMALVLQVVLVYCIICFLFKINAFKFLSKVRAPMITAFVTRSSGGTLPVSMKTAEEEMGISKGIFGFTLPIGATMNMDGTTIYLGVCAIFIANAVGVPLDFAAKLTIVLTAVLASVGTAGVPGAGAIMLLMVLESVGLKVEAGSAVAAAYALILGIDALLDMGRTSMNVVGDMAGTLIVAKSENDVDESKWE
ncbi:sodium:dicarboxylate symporter, SDF family [Campylobacter blaseri]|uniref:Dicarboxylate/amino acid:cation symporter n=1 Tax=Campylobacter blaseri TaxID=2042961 RepID=A0A2P8R2B1_9BACT|nr:dicarboxylate/amino acid:cation symporter [Campylobacter blaseri]PSM52629.1 dicarboxylate/amino acid:cation symporter [Campylobacter blaseri]PSM54277.1 dicarboxylate/amino acid:cation symporter [Campylobacter blaseri]QKF85928.1 sodium:dicarboxylate symporter, SDF family [Campylobacter blaseri]